MTIATGIQRETGAEFLVRWLEALGVEYVFGCCGHGNIGFLDALVDSGIRFISAPHEQIAAHAADAYARTSGKLAVVTTTIGPGLANIVNPVMDAAADCVPMLVIAGDTIRDYEGTDSFQEVTRTDDASQSAIFKPIAKRVWRVRQSTALANSAARAWSKIYSDGPGPVILSVAMDLFTYEDDYDLDGALNRWPTSRSIPATATDVEAVIDAVRNARRPVVFAGGGIIQAGASSELTAFCEAFGVPVVTSSTGQSGFPNDHALYAGTSGSVGTPTAHRTLQTADLVLTLGTRFGELDTNSWLPSHFIPESAKVIQIDIDPNEVGKKYSLTLGIVGDLKTVLAQILAANADQTALDRAEYLDEVASSRSQWLAEYRELAETDNEVPLQLEPILYDLGRALPKESVLVAGVTGARHRVCQYYEFTQPGSFILPSGHGTMGWATAAVIGAKLARPDVPVLGLVGDGDFRSLSEAVGVACEAEVPVVWMIMNNAAYSVIGLYQNRHYGRLTGTDFELYSQKERYVIDFVKLAEAYGALGIRVEKRDEIIPALEQAFASSRPVVIDVVTTDKPRYNASGFWDANRYFGKGWNIK